jgi:hypothetical protein
MKVLKQCKKSRRFVKAVGGRNPPPIIAKTVIFAHVAKKKE